MRCSTCWGRASRTWPTDPVFGATTVNMASSPAECGPMSWLPDAHADLPIRLVTEVPPVKTLLERAVRDPGPHRLS